MKWQDGELEMCDVVKWQDGELEMCDVVIV